MKKSIHIATFLFFVIAMNCFIAIAQKLPKIQEISKRAPTNIIIDGKAEEWNGEFLAYNVNNRIYYTISNDANYLYLIIRAADHASNEKALFGITFTIKNPTAINKDQRNISIVYPTQVEVLKQEPLRNAVTTIKRLISDTTKTSKRKIDSLRLFVNNNIPVVFKFIDVTGFTEIQDPSISIYNTENIRVGALLDDHIRYIYELAVPLKDLGTSIVSQGKFHYNIKMNGIPSIAKNGAPTPTVDGPINGIGAGIGFDNSYVSFATDFSGDYKLAK